MKIKPEKPVSRWLIKADGYIVDWAMSEKRACKLAWRFSDHVNNQDEPLFPKMEVVEEAMQLRTYTKEENA